MVTAQPARTSIIYKVRTSVIALAVGVVALSCSPHKHSRTFYRMSTYVSVSIVSPRAPSKQTWQALDSLLIAWDTRFSQEHPHSEVLRLNASAGATLPVSVELAEMISLGLRYADTLNGSFDPTIYPIKKLWSFLGSPDSCTIPSPEALAHACQHVDYTRVKLLADPPRIQADSGIAFDLGGIAKGGALLRVARFLNNAGYANYLIEAGGDIVCKGTGLNGKFWRVGISHPRQKDSIVAILPLLEGSIVTSGDYQRFCMVNGMRYHHLFDARTGYPTQKNQSVTLWTQNPINADILTTGLFSWQWQDIIAFVEAREPMECLVIDSAGQLHESSGWTRFIHTSAQP
jgi:thiamine biosynthesis lipoprotein